MPKTRPATDTAAGLPLGETGRTVISLLLFVHLFCLAVVLSGNYLRSPLQQRLIALVAPYTRLLNFDPDFTKFQLTHAAEEDDDHVIVVSLPDTPGLPLVRFPDVGWRGSDRYQRYQRLASALAFAANREQDSVTAEYAKAIGARVMAERGVPRVVVRCLRHLAPSIEQSRQERMGTASDSDASDLQPVYEADVWVAEDNSVQVLKRSSRREVAPTVNGDS